MSLDTNLIDRLKGHAEYIRGEAGEQLYKDLYDAIGAIEAVLALPADAIESGEEALLMMADDCQRMKPKRADYYRACATQLRMLLPIAPATPKESLAHESDD